MLSIGVIEVVTSGHMSAELCKIAGVDGHRVVLFTRPEFLPRIQCEMGDAASAMELVVAEPEESRRAFLSRIERYAALHLDLVIVNTMVSTCFATFRPRCKLLGYIYNTNWWIRDTRSWKHAISALRRPWLALIPYPIYNPVTSFAIKRRILTNLDGILVGYRPFIDLITKQHGVDKPVFFFPNFTNSGQPRGRGDGPMTFVVSGKIQEGRRDYDMVIGALKRVPVEAKARFRLVLLGKPIGSYGSRILTELQVLAATGYNVKCFEGFVPAAEFESTMAEADVIIAPLKRDFIDFSIRESFSITKETGSFADAVRFGIPSLVPDFYGVDTQVGIAFRGYRDGAHLAEHIACLALDPEKVAEWRAATAKAMAQYSLPNMQARFRDMCTQLALPARNT